MHAHMHAYVDFAEPYCACRYGHSQCLIIYLMSHRGSLRAEHGTFLHTVQSIVLVMQHLWDVHMAVWLYYCHGTDVT